MAFQPKSSVGQWGWIRVRILFRVVWRRLGFYFAAGYAMLSAADWAVDQFGSDWLIEKVRLGDNIPNLNGWQWATIGLALLSFLIVDGVARGLARSLPIDASQSYRGIHIVHGEYGVPGEPSQSREVTQGLRERVKDGRLYIASASTEELLGSRTNDPAFGTSKILTIQYTVDGKSHGSAWYWEDDEVALPSDNPPRVNGPPSGRVSRDASA